MSQVNRGVLVTLTGANGSRREGRRAPRPDRAEIRELETSHTVLRSYDDRTKDPRVAAARRRHRLEVVSQLRSAGTYRAANAVCEVVVDPGDISDIDAGDVYIRRQAVRSADRRLVDLWAELDELSCRINAHLGHIAADKPARRNGT